jgi:hypothetical protein
MANKAILFSEGCGEVGTHVSEVWTMPEELSLGECFRLDA